MTHLLSWMSIATVRDLGWTLVHFLWQGLLPAALLQAVLPLCRSAVARHNWALATLAVMAFAPVATFLFIHQQGSDITPQGSNTATISGEFPYDRFAPHNVLVPTSVLTPWIDWLVVLWLAGVVVLSARALGGWYLAETLRRRDVFVLPADLLIRCHAIQRSLGVKRSVQFLQSLRVSVPAVVGWVSPVILIPLSAVTGVPPQQLDALIMHELAHIQRNDAFVNILLLIVETILFYHPAVWWVGRRIRIERENCCDDLAVSRCGDASIYVEALTSLEASRVAPSLALVANGGNLRNRAARLLGVPSDTRRYSLPAIAGLALVSLILGTVAVAKPGIATNDAIVRDTPALATKVAEGLPLPPPVNPADHQTLNQLEFVGNSTISKEDLTKEIQLAPGELFSRENLPIYVKRIYEFYRRNGKYYARTEPYVVALPQNRVNLTFAITEGPTIGVARIIFVGNKAFSASVLRSQLATKESTQDELHRNDNYDPDRVMYDKEQLRRYYVSHGYVNFRVLGAVARLTPDKRSFNITYSVYEGSHENDLRIGP